MTKNPQEYHKNRQVSKKRQVYAESGRNLLLYKNWSA